MIPLVCSCGTKFKVKDEYAGKAVRCAHCQAVTRVPTAKPARPFMDFAPEFEDAPEAPKSRSTSYPRREPKPRRGYGALRTCASLNRFVAFLGVLIPIAGLIVLANSDGSTERRDIAIVVVAPTLAFFWYLAFRSSGELFDLTANVAEDIQAIRERAERM